MYVPCSLNTQERPERFGAIPELTAAVVCPVGRRRYERLSRRLRNWARFGYLFLDTVLQLLRRGGESSSSREGRLQGCETDRREQGNDC
jgi:hypothetical protein